MTTTPSPAPKPWRRSEAPGHTPKHAPPPKEGAGEKVKKVLKGTRDAAGKVLRTTAHGTGKILSSTYRTVHKIATTDVRDAASATLGTGKKIGSVAKGSKRKIATALGVAAVIGGGAYLYGEHRADEHRQRAAAVEKVNAVPRDTIILPVTIQVQDGKIKITPKSDVKTDQCGKEHTVTIQPADTEQIRKGRMRASKGSVRFTVEAHDKTYTYEADDDVVADEEERESTISAHLVDGETEK